MKVHVYGNNEVYWNTKLTNSGTQYFQKGLKAVFFEICCKSTYFEEVSCQNWVFTVSLVRFILQMLFPS